MMVRVEWEWNGERYTRIVCAHRWERWDDKPRIFRCRACGKVKTEGGQLDAENRHPVVKPKGSP